MNREKVTPFTFVKIHTSPLIPYVGQLLPSARVAMPTGPLAHPASCVNLAGPPTPSVHASQNARADSEPGPYTGKLYTAVVAWE